jgi:heat-inducible transcriptional repressor
VTLVRPTTRAARAAARGDLATIAAISTPSADIARAIPIPQRPAPTTTQLAHTRAWYSIVGMGWVGWGSRAEVRRLRDKVAVDGPLEEVLAHVSRVLADTTAEVGIALVPTSGHATLRSIHFAKVSAQRVLGIVVTTGGLVDSRLLSVDRDYQPIELERISNYCSESYAGMTLEEIRSRLLALMAEERARCDDVLAGVIELGRRAVDGEIGTQGELFLEGADHLFERAAPAHLEVLPRLFAAFADKAVLLNLLNDYLAASGPLVVIGSEFALAGSDDLGLIVRSFQCESGERGLVGVIGLKRMDYPRIIPIVDFVGKRVAKVGRAAGGFDER